MRIGARGSWTRLVACAACLAPLAVAPAQQGAFLVGRVLDHDGEPVAGAAVSLVSCRTRGPVGAVASDELLEALTDARGRFRVSVRAARSYSIDARWIDPEARVHVSGIHEGAVVGEFLELRESERSPLPRDWRVRVVGLDAWAAHGPFSYRVLTQGRSRRALAIEAREGGDELPIPPLPDGRGTLQVIDRNGGVLLGGALRAAPSRGLSNRDVLAVLRLDPPEVRELRVVSANQGEAIAGARVWYRSARERSDAVPLRRDGGRIEDWWREVGQTDAEGRIRCEVVPEPHLQRAEQVFLVEADGHAATVAGWVQGEPFVAWEQGWKPRRFGAALEVPLDAAVPVYGKLTWDGAQPMGGTGIVVSPLVGRRSGEMRWVLPDRTAVSDERGWFRMEGMPGHAVRYRLRAFVSEDAWRRHAAPDGPVADSVLPFGSGPLPAERIGASAEFGVARLDALRRLWVRVLDAEGLPVRGALIECLSDPEQLGARRSVEVRTDGRGFALLPTAHGERPILCAYHAQRGLAVVLHDDLRVDELVLRLERGVVLRGRVLDGDKAADPSAHLEVVELRVGPSEPDSRADQPRVVRGELHRGLAAVCDSEGRFALRVYPGPDNLLVLRFHGASGRAPFELDLDGPSIENDVVDLGDLTLPWR